MQGGSNTRKSGGSKAGNPAVRQSTGRQPPRSKSVPYSSAMSLANRMSIMDKSEFLKLMAFPAEWAEWDMYPDDLWEKQLHMYRDGDERGAEHDRMALFTGGLSKILRPIS